MKLKNVRIEPAEDGGFCIEACYDKEPEPSEDGKSEAMCCGGYEEKQFVATSTRELFDKLSKIFKSDESEMKDYMDD